MTKKQKKTIEKEIIEILEDFYSGYTPNSGRRGMYNWRDKILDVLHQTLQRFIKETKIEKWHYPTDHRSGEDCICPECNKITGYNEALKDINQNQQQWLKENLSKKQ